MEKENIMKFLFVFVLLFASCGIDEFLGKEKIEYDFQGVGVAKYLETNFQAFKNKPLPYLVIHYLPENDLWYYAKCESANPVTLIVKKNDVIIHSETGMNISFIKHEDYP